MRFCIIFLKMEATSLAGFELQCREIWSADREKKTEAEARRRLQRGGSGLPWLVRWQRAARMETASPEAVRSTRQSNRTERKSPTHCGKSAQQRKRVFSPRKTKGSFVSITQCYITTEKILK